MGVDAVAGTNQHCHFLGDTNIKKQIVIVCASDVGSDIPGWTPSGRFYVRTNKKKDFNVSFLT